MVTQVTVQLCVHGKTTTTIKVITYDKLASDESDSRSTTPKSS